MQTNSLFTPFTGVLMLPDKIVPRGTSPVFLDNEVVSLIRWRFWTSRGRFEVLDAAGASELAHGQAEGFARRRYVVYGPAGEVLLQYKQSWRGTGGHCKVTLPAGAELTAKGNWSSRRFTVMDPNKVVVAQINATTRIISMRPNSYAFELYQPVFSPVQAIGLAQCIRAAVQSNSAND